MIASPLKIVASSRTQKNPKAKKIVDTRKNDLKAIRTQLNKISSDERKRVQVLWDLHKELFTKSSEDELEIEVVPEKSIDEFFEK
jgi:hypothetical protein